MRTFQSGKLAKASLLGEGAEAVLRYLARYVFRAAIANSRIESLDEDGAAFRYKHRASNRWRQIRLSGPEFMRRFLQHVLPKGLHKVRYYGLWHPSKRGEAAKARLLLLLQPPQSTHAPAQPAKQDSPLQTGTAPLPRLCQACGEGCLLHVRSLYPRQPERP